MIKICKRCCSTGILSMGWDPIRCDFTGILCMPPRVICPDCGGHGKKLTLKGKLVKKLICHLK